MKIGLAVLFVLAGWCTSVSALPLVYDELLGGDLGSSVLTDLDVGTNTVSGSVRLGEDAWTAGVVTGGEITKIEFKIIDTPSFFEDLVMEVLRDGFIFSGTSLIQVDPAGIIVGQIFDMTPVDLTGPLFFDVRQGSGFLGTVDYQWIVTVESTSVPEPSSLILLCLGLLSIATRRKKIWGHG